MSTPRVAFLGLGTMGSGMARRLLDAGFPLTVFNRNPARAAGLASAGATVADSPRAAAARADIIVSMVADDQAARAVWLGKDGAIAGAAKGTLCIESSTVSPGWVRELSAAAAARGCEFLDAPVTGSRVHAAAGELRFLVGGAAASLERARPVLSAMGKTITHLGPVGCGALVKLINNFVCGVQVAALAEAVAMIERSGLDRAGALEVLTHGAPGSPLVRTIAARMTASDYTPNFFLKLMAKDLSYAIQEGRGLSVELSTATAALGDFQSAIAAGLGDKDMSAVAEPLRRRQIG
jgi:3-hydroxyisobutyrate dehydrogenase